MLVRQLQWTFIGVFHTKIGHIHVLGQLNGLHLMSQGLCWCFCQQKSSNHKISWPCGSYISRQVRLKKRLILCDYIFDYVNPKMMQMHTFKLLVRLLYECGLAMDLLLGITINESID